MSNSYSGPAAICCHHCGRDYACEYWAMAGKGDPFLCRSCRRDTNRDAAEAPRWAGEIAMPEPRLRAMVVSQSRKRCRVCGGEWDGLIFGPPASKGSPLPFGICPSCDAKETAYLQTLTTRLVPIGVPLPALNR